MKIQGYATITHPEKGTVEHDTITCSHCNRIVFLKPGSDAGGFCRMCMKSTCGPCADLGSCTPFEKKMELQERQSRLLKTAGVV